MVRLPPARVSLREGRAGNGAGNAGNSTALCHGWKANVVDHMYQNSVSKKPVESQPVMQLAAKVSSLAWLQLQQFDAVIHGEPHRSFGNLRAAAAGIRLMPFVEFHGFVEDGLAWVEKRGIRCVEARANHKSGGRKDPTRPPMR